MGYDSTKPYTNKVLDLIKETWNGMFCQVLENHTISMKGCYSYNTIDHTDGIGTKGYYHWNQKTYKNAAIDALAMNLNDLAMVNAIPFKLQNHIFLPEDNHDAIYQIIGALVSECKKRGIAITGGETSIHNNMNGMDISVCMSGLASNRGVAGFKKDRWPLTLETGYQKDDILVGLPSAGLHSNGFTKVHEKLRDFRPEFVEPTKIYIDTIRKIHYTAGERAETMNHITGGAFTKLKPNLNKNIDAVLEFKNKEVHPIFYELFESGISSEEMYKTFNCGYGFIIGCSPEKVDHVVKVTGGVVLGAVVNGTGKITITSAFDGKVFDYV